MVVDAPLGPDAVRSVGDRRVVVVDAEPGFAGAHAVASLESLRSAVLGLPPPAGPVRS